MPEKTSFLFGDLEFTEEAALDQIKLETTPAVLEGMREVLGEIDELTLDEARTVMKRVQKASGIKGKNLFMPIRAAITGNVHGPEMPNIIYLLGKDKILERLAKAEEVAKA